MIFSSRTIPGNEKAVGRHPQRPRQDGYRDRHRPRRPRPCLRPSAPGRDGRVLQGCPAADRPCRCTARRCISRSTRSSPRQMGVKTIGHALNGRMLRLAPGPVAVVDEAFSGRLFRDGNLLVEPDRSGAAQRRKAAFAGVVFVGLTIDAKGNSLADPQVALVGLPTADARGRDFAGAVETAAPQHARGPAACAPQGRRDGVGRGQARCARRRQRALGQEADRRGPHLRPLTDGRRDCPPPPGGLLQGANGRALIGPARDRIRRDEHDRTPSTTWPSR